MHERGWLYLGHRSTEWCPRCGTSISAHELVGSYVDRADPSLYVRLPLLDRQGEALVIWTTTPWTLPANVAAAVKPDAEYGRRENGEWVAVGRYPDETFLEQKRGEELVGWRYAGPFDDLPPGAGVEHRVIPWEEVTLDDGTGIVHIAPGCGAEDFELSRVHDLPVLTPVDESGRFYDDYGWLHGLSTVEAAEQIIGYLEEQGRLVEAGLHEHRYPECWRCHTPLIFRISDDWFIAVDELRQQLRDANAEVEWTPGVHGQADGRLAREHGRLEHLPPPLLRAAAAVLPLRLRAPERDRVEGGAGGAGARRARPARGAAPALDRRGADPLRAVRRGGDGGSPRSATSGSTPGIVPFSTLGWQSPEYVPEGYATGAAKGLTTADLPDHAYWEEWFPADWVSEMREQIRLWFYSQLFMSVVLTGRAPYRQVLGYEKMLDETGREMHSSWGNTIDAPDAFARMGADVMRWQFCTQPPDRNLLFGFGPAHEIKRKLLTLWNSARFLADYATIEGFRPDYGAAPPVERPLDRWLAARTDQLVAEATAGYDAFLTVNVTRAFEEFVDDVSNWYIRRSRRRFWDGDASALQALWHALVQGIRVVAPVMPFLAEHLWQSLVREAAGDPPASVHLAGWPEAGAADTELLEEVAELRRVVGLGHQARAAAQLKLRQPLRRLIVEGAPLAEGHAEELREELRVKDVEFGHVDATELHVKPHLPVLGPKLGKELGAVRAALAAGDFEQLDGGGFRVLGHELGADEVLVERSGKSGWAVASDEGVTVALDTAVDPELELEGRVYDLIHTLNSMRKEQGLELTDRIAVTLPTADADLVERHAEWIKTEVLAVSLETDGVEQPQIAKV